MLVNFVRDNNINNPSELKMNASIVKHVEQSEIIFRLLFCFEGEYIPDDIIISMLSNVERRI